MLYNWQMAQWPAFQFSIDELQDLFLEYANQTGEINGILAGLPENLASEVLVQTMLSEAMKTSEIEGEYLSREDVMSSIRNNLGLNEQTEYVKDQRAAGIGKLIVEVRKTFQEPLAQETLYDWHHLLFSFSKQINAGAWRSGTEPMQVISGTYGKEIVHFEAPPSAKVAYEMEHFLNWFNKVIVSPSGNIQQALIHCSIAHLYFESIHPFEDGNGRIGRAIAEKALSRVLNRPVLLSLSKEIEKNKKAYYDALKQAQQTLNITLWIKYFLTTIVEAQKDAKNMALFTLHKARLFDKYKHILNERQTKVLNKMLDAGVEGFEGGMTAKKYISITQSSKATATRDLQHLHEIGILKNEGAGRNVRYHLQG